MNGKADVELDQLYIHSRSSTNVTTNRMEYWQERQMDQRGTAGGQELRARAHLTESFGCARDLAGVVVHMVKSVQVDGKIVGRRHGSRSQERQSDLNKDHPMKLRMAAFSCRRGQWVW